LRSCTAQTFAGTFVIAWAQRVPTGQLLGGWKLRHVVPYLSEKGHSIDPRYRVPASHRLRQLRLLSADVLQAFFEQSNFVFHKLYLIQ
jgi:hypothetical protein